MYRNNSVIFVKKLLICTLLPLVHSFSFAVVLTDPWSGGSGRSRHRPTSIIPRLRKTSIGRCL
nr:MAG TPA: hypothetical protein [Bacteriophage sp.]